LPESRSFLRAGPALSHLNHGIFARIDRKTTLSCHRVNRRLKLYFHTFQGLAPLSAILLSTEKFLGHFQTDATIGRLYVSIPNGSDEEVGQAGAVVKRK
jgi:hypothetical protein